MPAGSSPGFGAPQGARPSARAEFASRWSTASANNPALGLRGESGVGVPVLSQGGRELAGGKYLGDRAPCVIGHQLEIVQLQSVATVGDEAGQAGQWEVLARRR